MRVPRIYFPGPLPPDTSVALDERATRHLVRVLRLQPGAPLVLFNGQGGEYQAVLDSFGKRGASARITRHVPREAESRLHLVLGQCVPRGPRMDYILQKAVELGVTAIAPLTSERCEVKLPPERLAARLEHWRGVCVSACEQCGRNRIPTVHAPLALDAWLHRDDIVPADLAPTALRLVLHAAGERHLLGLPGPGGALVLLSGPEGGLTGGEIALAERSAFTPVSLGPRILRAETAPVAALTAVQALWGDLG